MKPTFKVLIFTLLVIGSVIHSARAVQAHVTLTQTGTNFAYTVSNDEPAQSVLLLSAFHVTANAPFNVVASPPGWTFFTDNFTYVDWLATDSPPPFTNNIPPGSSLSGFVLQSQSPVSEPLSYSLVSWDTSTNLCGPSIQGSIAAPSVTNLAPTLILLSDSVSPGIHFTLPEFPTFSYVIESSTNLTDWFPMTTNSAPFSFLDANAQDPQRFYRCLFLPDPASWDALPD
jgi:hypothetical protein